MSKIVSFLRRFSFFLLGLAIGLFILNRIMAKKQARFDYLPNARTLSSIRNNPIIYFSDEAKQALSQRNLDTIQAMTLLSDGDVNFSKSQKRLKPCPIFVIEPTDQTPNISIVVERCDSVSVIKSIN